MKFWSALLFLVFFLACITRLHAPDGNEESFAPLTNEGKPDLSEASSSDTKTEETQQFPLSDGSLTTSQEISSSLFSSTSQLDELVTPTVAPATPSYDAELSSTIINSASSIESYLEASDYVLSSVILIPPSDPAQIQSSQGSQDVKHSTYSEAALPTKEPEVLSSVLDSAPPNPISSEPTPTPPSAAIPKEGEEDSITAALYQAEEESKPKEEEMPSFDEFKRRVLQEEEEKSKLQQSAENVSGAVQKPKKLKERKQSNFASVDCGAKILEHNSEASNAGSILVENKDLYMLNPCSAQVWFVVELCDLAQVRSIQIANFELFSSTPESFRVYVSKRYPTREWTMLGTFQAREERDTQTFPLDEPIYAKYFKVEMLSHFGSEHYCPLSLLRVHGSSMMEELEDHEIDGQEENDNTDSDSDVPVLPSDPSAKVDDEPKKQNLLERAADTVISLVKKFTGNGHDREKGDVVEEGDGELNIPNSNNRVTTSASESQDESKGKIVILVGHEELKENPDSESNVSIAGAEQDPSDNRNTSQEKLICVNISHEDSSLCKEVEDEGKSKTTSTAPSLCQLFSRVVGQYSLGCFMGRLLFWKNENFTLSLNLAKSENFKTSRKLIPSADQKEKNESYETKQSDDQRKIPAEEAPTREKPSAVESLEEQSSPSEETNPEFSVINSEPSFSNVETTSEIVISSPSEVVQTVDASSRIVQPSQSVDSLVTGKQKSGPSDDKTPALEEVSVVTSMPVNSTHSATSSVTLQSSEVPVFHESFVDVVTEEPGVGDEQPVQSLPSGQSTVVNGDHAPSLTDDDSRQPAVPLEIKDAISMGEEQREDQITNKDKLNDVKQEHETEATPSECNAPNSLHMMSQSSPDIDVLETKLTDKDGREGTAQLPEDVNIGKDLSQHVNGASVSTMVADSPSKYLEPADMDNKGMSPDMENQENNSEITASSTTVVESPSVDPTVQPTSPPSIDTPDLADYILPLPAPPIISDTIVSSQEFAAASSDANLDAALLSKAQQAAATSAGMSSVVGSGGQKESIFVRLSNKIKALEQNLNMSTLYMEQLHQRYRKSLDELQKNSDKKVALLTNATKKAEAVINNQKEQITKLQSKLDNLTSLVDDMKARMDPLNKEVMERHVIGLCIEIVLILVLFIVFAKRNNNRVISNTPRGSMHLMNGHGPPRLAIEDGGCNKDTVMSTVSPQSGREQLLCSFGQTPGLESIGASTATDSLSDNKLHMADTCNPSESKKKRHRKRKASNTSEPPPDSPSYDTSNIPEPPPYSHPSADAPSPASFVSRTAGLLFFSARGFFGGFHNQWKQKKPSSVHSDPNISARSENNQVNKTSLRLNNRGVTRAKSLDLVPEETASQRHEPPPAPPLPCEFGVMFKRPPDCYYPKKGSAKSILPGPLKHGKYGVLDTQLA